MQRSPDRDTRWQPGLVVDDWRIDDVEGVGGHCVVYRATDVVLDRTVALKVVLRDGVDDDDVAHRRARLEREARALARVRSTRVARVHALRRVIDPLTQSPELVVVLEHCPGTTLARLLQRQRHLPVARAIALAREVALGVQAIHDVSLVHRDLKPQNIIVDVVDGCERVKVIDLGIVSFGARTNDDEAPLTRRDDVIGTLGFMSPEQMLKKTVDARADVYAFGAILYRALCGSPVFGATTLPGIVRAHVQATPASLCDRAPHLGIPADLDQLVRACLEKDPAWRPSSMSEIVRRLDTIDLDDDVGVDVDRRSDVTRRVSTPGSIELTPTLKLTSTPAAASAEPVSASQVSPLSSEASSSSEAPSLEASLESSPSSLSSRVSRRARLPETPKPVTMLGVSIHDEHTLSRWQ